MALKQTLIYGSLLAITALGGSAAAQQARLNTPSATFEHRAIEMPDATGPLATPGVFNYDAQMFAPVEFTNDKQLEPNCGFFFTIDKTYTHVSRSDRNGTSRTEVPIGGDWNWGERYQLGFMTEADSGWHASYQGAEGTFYTQGNMDDALRSIVILPDGTSDAGEEDFLNGFGPRLLTSGSGTVTDNTTVPFNFADSFTNEFHVGELNRVFRQALTNGGYFEPYIGARYTNVNDQSRQDNVYYYTPNDSGAPDSHDNVLHRFRQTASNNAIGLQLGGRHNRRRGRWIFSTDGAVSASYNQQRYTSTDILFNDRERSTIIESYVEESSFLPTLDLDLGLSFNITRDITIRGGAQFMYLWGGISRVNTLPADLNPNSVITTPDFQNEQFVVFPTLGVNGGVSPPDIGNAGIFDDSFIATGLTLGVEWKR